MRIYLMGRHANRTPFSYAVYRKILERFFTYVEDPAQADVIILGYVVDIDKNISTLEEVKKKNPSCRIVVVSEEPLWDTTNSGDFWERHNTHIVGRYDFKYSVINHHTSHIYDFDRLPYFITTDDKFYLRYSQAFSKNARMTPKDLLQTWKAASIRYAFFAEKRELSKKYSVSWPDINTWGLSVYRTDVAKGMPNKETMRVGAGWSSAVTRQQLPDWHLDKLTTLRGRSMIVSALENTNQRNYISEKIFDAYAVGGIPLYWAAPGHRVDEIVPPESYLNLFDLDPEAAVKKVISVVPDLAKAEAHLAAQASLAQRFQYYDDLLYERFSFADRLSEEVFAIVSE